MNITWAEEYAARFKPLSPRDVEVWEEILQQEIRNLSAGETAKAVRLLGEEKQQGKHKYAPSVEDLKAAIVKGRWLSSPKRNTIQNDACSLCQGTGWMSFGASQNQNELSLGVSKHLTTTGWSYGIYAAPCLCSIGAQRLCAYPPDDRPKITKLAKDAFEFKKNVTDASPIEDQLMAAV